MDTLNLDFDVGPSGRGARFSAPRLLFRADHLDQVAPCFEAMETARSQGLWLAGMMSYELGYGFSDRLSDIIPEQRDVPLMLFGAYDAPEALVPEAPPFDGVLDLSAGVTRAGYDAAFAKAKEYIAAGDVYQINLTFPLVGRTSAAPRALYAALKQGQPVGHGCLVEAGDFALLSRSPELFFSVDENRQAVARPMKGTAPRGTTPEQDRVQAEWLRGSEKNRAENLMIVDLMRNDLSRIAEIGSVKVPKLFEIETYATLHQMTSTVTANLLPVTFAAMAEALFPCGSITGAPKIRAMQIIRELEPFARGAYCGAIGWIAPSGAMEFSVAIRTLTLRDGKVVLNVGGGIVADSRVEEEWEEALCKAAFATSRPQA
ncbi:aminodeoxychorismate synthase component I [Leptospira interrogans]